MVDIFLMKNVVVEVGSALRFGSLLAVKFERAFFGNVLYAE